MKTIQQIMEEERAKSQINKISEGRINNLIQLSSMLEQREANGWSEKNRKAQEKANKDPVVRKNKSDANKIKSKDPKWIEANKKGLEKRMNNPAAKLNHLAAMKKVHDNPLTAINRQIGIDNRNKNPAFGKSISEGKKQPIHVPWGDFPSMRDAINEGKKLGIKNTTRLVPRSLKDDPENFYLIKK